MNWVLTRPVCFLKGSVAPQPKGLPTPAQYDAMINSFLLLAALLTSAAPLPPSGTLWPTSLTVDQQDQTKLLTCISNCSLHPISSSLFHSWTLGGADGTSTTPPAGARHSGTGGRTSWETSEDVLGLDGGGAHRSWADSPSDTSYFISGFSLLPPHCTVINTVVGRPVFFSLLVPQHCLSVSPDKRRALPKHWFPIDFSFIRLPSFVTLPLDHCFYLQVSQRPAAPSHQPSPERDGGGGHLGATHAADWPPFRGRQRGQRGKSAASVSTFQSWTWSRRYFVCHRVSSNK